jgi:DNA-binding beta-propeller fold protein YncE
MNASRRPFVPFAALTAALVALTVPLGARQGAKAPTFQVDPTWPQEFSNHWVMGSVTGVFVDSRNHVWITSLPETLTEEETSEVQNPPIATCCKPGPVVIELDDKGKVVQGWGDRAKEEPEKWPRNPHGIFVDHTDHVWIGTHMHHRVMKFTRDGKLVLTIGEYDKNNGSNDQKLLGGPSGIWVDPKSNEVFISDGYRNRRVVVFDGATGAYKRHWGAYGKPPDDSEKFDPKTMASGALPQSFSTPHGITGSNDGRIYVADRRGNRIQVFEQSGKFVAEKVIAPATLASGSSFVPVLSKDPQQQWLYVADGTNHKVWILNRQTLEIAGEFGRGGRQLGQFLRPHGMSIDSAGNLYVGEASTGRRVQRFLMKK